MIARINQISAELQTVRYPASQSACGFKAIHYILPHHHPTATEKEKGFAN